MFLNFLRFNSYKWRILGVSASSAVVYFGVVIPVQNSRNIKEIPGSLSSLDHRDHFVRRSPMDLNFPSIFPLLSLEDIEQRNYEKTGVPSKILDHLNLSSHRIKELGINKSNDFNGIEKDLELIGKWIDSPVKTLEMMSEAEIPNKPTVFMKVIHGMEKSDFIQDLIWSLSEESRHKKFSVRPNSINVDFDLSPSSNENIEHIYPSLPRKVSDFSFSFTVFNPNRFQLNIFGSIPLSPMVETHVTIRAKKAEIRPYSLPVSFSGTQYKGANWNLFPMGSDGFSISLSNKFPNTNRREMTSGKLNFVFGRSRFFSNLISISSGKPKSIGARALNSPTFLDFKKEADPLLSSIDADQIKKDIELWYGAMKKQHMKLMSNEVIKFLKMVNSKIYSNGSGKSSSFGDMFTKDKSFRVSIYDQLSMHHDVRSLIDSVLDNQPEGEKVEIEEIYKFLQELGEKSKKIGENLKITFQWLEKPKLDNSSSKYESIYPTVSMKFSVEVEAEEEIDLTLNSKDFKISKKSTNIHAVFPFLKRLFSGFLKLDEWKPLIPDVQKFIGWDALKIPKNTKTKQIYEVNKSPISPSMDINPDSRDNNNRLVVFGWKILDASITTDYSGAVDLLYQLYEKMDTEKSLSCDNVLSCSWNKYWYSEEQPFTFVFSLLNDSIFEKGTESPLKIFAKNLFNTTQKVDSQQMFVGYSGAFFDTKPDFVNKLKEASNPSSPDKLEFKTSTKSEEYDVTSEQYSFYAEPKTEGLRRIINSFHFNYSTFFPNKAILFKDPGYGGDQDEYVKFLSDKTDMSLKKDLDKLKEIIKSNYYSVDPDGSIFPREKFIKWENVKVSLTRWKLAEALRSVISNPLRFTGTAILWKLGITINDFIGELLDRDLYTVTVNLMMEDGSLRTQEYPNRNMVNSFDSVHSFSIQPKLNREKWEHLKNSIG